MSFKKQKHCPEKKKSCLETGSFFRSEMPNNGLGPDSSGALRLRCRCAFCLVSRGLWQHETETNFATLGCGTSLTAGALFWSLMSAQAADFFENAFHLQFGLQALEGAVYWLTFTDLDFWHTGFVEKGLKNGERA